MCGSPERARFLCGCCLALSGLARFCLMLTQSDALGCRVRLRWGQSLKAGGRYWKRVASLSTTMRPMFREAVAAGLGALQTLTTRSVS